MYDYIPSDKSCIKLIYSSNSENKTIFIAKYRGKIWLKVNKL